MRLLIVLILAIAVSAASAQSDGPGLCVTDAGGGNGKIALVIGNQNYRQKGWALRTPLSDIALIAQRLRTVGFSVTLCTDLGQRKLGDAFNGHGARLAEAVKDGGDPVGLIYFAGHGQQFGGANYLIPVDANLRVENDVRNQAVTAQLALDFVQDAKNDINFLFLDACRDRPFESFERSAPRGLANMGDPVGTYIGYSTRPGHIAEDGPGSNSPFAKAFADMVLVEAIKAEAMFKAVALNVYYGTNKRQLPWQEGIILGEFCFAGCGEKDFGDAEEQLQAALVSDGSGISLQQLEYEALSRGAPQPDAPRQILVDAYGDGPYKTISAALEDIAVGGVIEVAFGEYNETITLTKSVAIVGQKLELIESVSLTVDQDAVPPPLGRVTIRPDPEGDEPCLVSQVSTTFVHLENLAFEAPINSRSACMQVDAGYITINQTDILGSTTQPAIRIAGGTAIIERNRIGAGSPGVIIEQAHSLSRSFVIDNKILMNKVGINVASGSRGDVVIAGNEIYDNLDSGVTVSGYGAAKLIGNKIRNNVGAGVILDKYSKFSLLRYNEIIQNGGDGIAIPFGVNGVIEDNDIAGNEGLSIFVREGRQPIITNNHIANNKGDEPRRRR